MYIPAVLWLREIWRSFSVLHILLCVSSTSALYKYVICIYINSWHNPEVVVRINVLKVYPELFWIKGRSRRAFFCGCNSDFCDVTMVEASYPYWRVLCWHVSTSIPFSNSYSGGQRRCWFPRNLHIWLAQPKNLCIYLPRDDSDVQHLWQCKLTW